MVLCLKTSIIHSVRVRRRRRRVCPLDLWRRFILLMYRNPSETSMQEVCEWNKGVLGLRGGCKAARRSRWWLRLLAVRCWGGCRERNGKRVLPKCSGAVLLPCTLKVMCPALTPISLCCSLLDTVAHTLHIQYVRLLLQLLLLFCIFFFSSTAAVFVFITAKHTQLHSPYDLCKNRRIHCSYTAFLIAC